MSAVAGTVLVLNSGSSSLKYQLLHPETGEVVHGGIVERIGETAARDRPAVPRARFGGGGGIALGDAGSGHARPSGSWRVAVSGV